MLKIFTGEKLSGPTLRLELKNTDDGRVQLMAYRENGDSNTLGEFEVDGNGRLSFKRSFLGERFYELVSVNLDGRMRVDNL